MHEAEVAVAWDAHLGGWPVALLGIESRPGAAPWAGARRRPRPVDLGHAVPAGLQEDRPRDQRRVGSAGRWWCWPTSPGSTGRRSRCGACNSSTAPRSAAAIVNFDGPIAFCVISRFHGGAFVVFSRDAQREPRVERDRGLLRLGDRRRARRRGRVHARGQSPDGRRPPDRGARRANRAAQRAPSASICAPSATRLWAEVRSREARRVRGRVRRDPQHRARGRGRLGRADRRPPRSCGPYLIDAVERGMQRTLARLAGSAVNGGAANGDDRDGRQSRWASARSSASSSSGSRVTSGSATGSA